MYKIYKNHFLSLVIISLSFLAFLITPSLVKADSYTPISVDCIKHGSGTGCNNYSASTGGLPASRIDWSVMADGFGDSGPAGGNVGLWVCFSPNRSMWNGPCAHAIKDKNTIIVKGPCGGSGINQDGKIGDLDGCGFTGKLETTDPAQRYMNAQVFVNDAHLWGTIALYGKSPIVEEGCPSGSSPDAGNSCTKSNSCGLTTTTGTIQCDGSCDAATPPESSCPSPGRFKCLATNQCGWDPNDTGTTDQCSVNADCTSASPIDGSCLATHYRCSAGTSSGTTGDTSLLYKWDCNGSGAGHKDASCSESKSPVYDSKFISQIVPTTMYTGQQYSVSVTMKNTGTNTWTAADTFNLGSQNPQDNRTWESTARIPVSGSVGPNTQTTFSFTVIAPSVGIHNFQWRMVRDEGGGGWFGEYSTNVSVSVINAPSSLLPDLTAGGISISTATVGAPINFLSIITNIGNAATH